MSEYIDNQSKREEQLKAIIRRLHEGTATSDLVAEFAELLEDVGPDEIVRIEEALVDEGLDPEQIQPLCDLHVEVFKTSLDKQQAPETTPGHPIFTYRAENYGVERVLRQLEETAVAYATAPSEALQDKLRATVEKLTVYDRHYLRKENLLFSFLERTGFAGPSKVMWGVHNDIRAMWKAMGALFDALASDPGALASELDSRVAELASAIRDMIYKEDHILFPAALKRLTDADWKAIRDQGDEIGYAYALPGRGWQPTSQPDAEATPSPAQALTANAGALIPLSTGALSADQIDLMLKALPVDVTYVDENDRVQYFSQSRERIFQRAPAIIGRSVQNCHPPQSVDKVQRILDDFRAGTRDEAAFWIQMGGMFVHIRYIALRDDDGTYRGTAEVTQNLAPLRALEGERRLLDD